MSCMYFECVIYLGLFCHICRPVWSHMYVCVIPLIYVGLFCHVCRSLMSCMYFECVIYLGLFCHIHAKTYLQL